MFVCVMLVLADAISGRGKNRVCLLVCTLPPFSDSRLSSGAPRRACLEQIHSRDRKQPAVDCMDPAVSFPLLSNVFRPERETNRKVLMMMSPLATGLQETFWSQVCSWA